MQESVAVGELLITHIDSEENLSDLMTKVTNSDTADWLVTSFMTSMMTILNNEARPANPDRLILRGLKKSACGYSTYLHLTFWLKGRTIQKILFASPSSKFCVPGGSCFGYSVFPGVMFASLMHSSESLFQNCNSFY